MQTVLQIVLQHHKAEHEVLQQSFPFMVEFPGFCAVLAKHFTSGKEGGNVFLRLQRLIPLQRRLWALHVQLLA